MKPEFPLYRSVVFWLGWFVLIFLMWAWADSGRTQTAVMRMWVLEDPAVGIPELHARYFEGGGFDSGSLMVTWTRVRKMGPGMRVKVMPFKMGRRPADLGGEWVDGPKMQTYEDRSAQGAAVVTVYRVVVPMWGVTGIYVMMWGGVMVWRWRRWMRLASEGRVM